MSEEHETRSFPGNGGSSMNVPLGTWQEAQYRRTSDAYARNGGLPGYPLGRYQTAASLPNYNRPTPLSVGPKVATAEVATAAADPEVTAIVEAVQGGTRDEKSDVPTDGSND